LDNYRFTEADIEPKCAEEVGDQFKKWIEANKPDAWFAQGGWLNYPVLLRWQVYQEINAYNKSVERGKQMPFPHVS
jgi:hypothetical protein